MSTTTKPAGANGGSRDTNDFGRSEVARNSPLESKKQPAVIGELFGGDTCSAAGITATGHAPVLALCRQLLAAGLNPDQALDIYRGAILALRVRSIGEGAGLEVNPQGTGFVPFRAARTAPPMRRNEVAHIAGRLTTAAVRKRAAS